jgi:ADP-ribosylglycohydrolase
MLGAIAGDVIGSVFEVQNTKSTDFKLFSKQTTFTDDSVLTVAIADAIIRGQSYKESVLAWGRRYPDRGYGWHFGQWLFLDDPRPYNSWGNGSAMRVSPIGWAFDSLEKTIEQAKISAGITHNHPEGLKGAAAVAAAIYLARTGENKKIIKKNIAGRFEYNLDRTLDEIRPSYTFDASCQGTVPEAIIAFMESENFEDSIRKAISLGGDSDTLACIAGGLAEAFYGGVPEAIETRVLELLPEEIRIVIRQFQEEYIK